MGRSKVASIAGYAREESRDCLARVGCNFLTRPDAGIVTRLLSICKPSHVQSVARRRPPFFLRDLEQVSLAGAAGRAGTHRDRDHPAAPGTPWPARRRATQSRA